MELQPKSGGKKSCNHFRTFTSPFCSVTYHINVKVNWTALKILLLDCFDSFYRFVLESDVGFLANDTVSPGPVARFVELPESPLLTLNMITPESWMVQAVRSPYDLDNIHLQKVSWSLAITSQHSYCSHLLNRTKVLSINHSLIYLFFVICGCAPGDRDCDSRV